MLSSIMWKSVNMNFGQPSLHLTHCAAPPTDSEPRYLGPILHQSRSACLQQPSTQLLHLNSNRGTQLLLWPSAASDATDTQPLSEEWPRNATSKPRFTNTRFKISLTNGERAVFRPFCYYIALGFNVHVAAVMGIELMTKDNVLRKMNACSWMKVSLCMCMEFGCV
jgi:hypothetical protein